MKSLSITLAAVTFGNRWFRINLDEPDRGAAAGATQTQSGGAAATADPTDAIVAAVAGRIDASLAPVLQRVSQVESRLAAATQPQSQSGVNPIQALGGRAPAGHTGERANTSRGYQFQRIIGFRQGQLAAEECKVEFDVHNRLMQTYVRQGGMRLDSPQSGMLCPLSAEFMPDADESFRTEVRQMLNAGVHGIDLDDMRRIRQAFLAANGFQRQAMSIYDDTAGGIFAGPTQQGDIIELMRAREVFSRLGATTVPLPPNGRIQFPRETGAGTAYWVGEKAAITESQINTGALDMMAKKLAVLYKLPNELLRFTIPAMEAFVRNSMARTMALKMDATSIDGAGSTTSPKGLLNYSGIKTITAATVGNNGNTIGPKDPSKLMAAIEEAEFDPELDGFSFIMRPAMWQDLLHRRADAVTANDEAGPWLFHVNRDDIRAGQPAQLEGGRVIKSTICPNNRSKGSASNLSCLIGGIFQHWLIGRIGVLEVATSTQGDTPFTTDQTWVRLIQHCDAAPRYEAAFGVIDKLVMPTLS